MLAFSSGFTASGDITSGLVGYYPCTEGSGSTIADTTATVGDMVFTGPVSWGASWVSLPGTSAASTTRTWTLSAGQAFSFTAALRLNAANSDTWRVVYDATSGNYPQLWFTNISSLVDGRLLFDATGYETAGSFIGTWVHVSVSKPAGTSVATYYINGSATTGVNSYATAAINLTFFRRGTASYFYGDARRIRLYNRAITPSEVAVIYGLDAI